MVTRQSRIGIFDFCSFYSALWITRNYLFNPPSPSFIILDSLNTDSTSIRTFTYCPSINIYRIYIHYVSNNNTRHCPSFPPLVTTCNAQMHVITTPDQVLYAAADWDLHSHHLSCQLLYYGIPWEIVSFQVTILSVCFVHSGDWVSPSHCI